MSRSLQTFEHSSSLSLEGVDDIKGSDSLSLGVLSVGDGVSDDVLEESSEDGSGLLVDVRADSLDTTSSGESSDGWLGDSKDGLLDGLGVTRLARQAQGVVAVALQIVEGTPLRRLMAHGIKLTANNNTMRTAQLIE